MIVRSPAWIVIVGGAVLSASGALGTVGNALIGIDGGIRAAVDLRTLVTKAFPPKPKFVPLKPVVIPKKAK